MRPVVLDTSVALPAVLSPRGYRRRFLVLLAYGALAARREFAREEAAMLRREAQAAGSPAEDARLDAIVRDAEQRYARFAALMPAGCPDEWRLVGSRPLLAEYARKLRETGPRLASTLDAHAIEIARRQLEIACAEVTEDFQSTAIPRYTSDRNDDPIVHTALLADAAWLIADDRKHIATNPDGVTEYHLPGTERRICAITFSNFLARLTDVDLDHIDPSLLATAFRAMPGRPRS